MSVLARMVLGATDWGRADHIQVVLPIHRKLVRDPVALRVELVRVANEVADSLLDKG